MASTMPIWKTCRKKSISGEVTDSYWVQFKRSDHMCDGWSLTSSTSGVVYASNLCSEQVGWQSYLLSSVLALFPFPQFILAFNEKQLMLCCLWNCSCKYLLTSGKTVVAPELRQRGWTSLTCYYQGANQTNLVGSHKVKVVHCAQVSTGYVLSAFFSLKHWLKTTWSTLRYGLMAFSQSISREFPTNPLLMNEMACFPVEKSQNQGGRRLEG